MNSKRTKREQIHKAMRLKAALKDDWYTGKWTKMIKDGHNFRKVQEQLCQ